MNYLLTITLSLLILLPLYGQQSSKPYAEAELISKQLITGEQTNLIIRLRGAQPDYRPAPPTVPNTAVNFVRSVTQMDTQRRLTQVFLYRLTPAKPGSYTIPPVVMSSGGKQLQSQPVTFQVHDPAKLISLSTGISGKNILAGWFPAKTSLYQGEQCSLVLKLYAPEQLRLASWGLPDPVKENCLAWRFSLPPQHQLGRASINGTPHLSARYETILSGIQPGTATLGPTKLRIVIRQRIIDPRLGPRISDIPVELTLPTLKFNILPFPQGAPADFQGAVGQFQIRGACSKLTFNDTDTTEVTLQVGGTGNLENIQPPALTGSDWKVIDTSKITRGQERRFISGVVTYRQLLRVSPGAAGAAPPSSIPPYSFSYFDPNDQSYHTLTTDAIPVSIIPTSKPQTASNNASGSNEKPGTPPEEMRGILGFINNPSPQNFKTDIFASKLWHITPAVICLIIITIPVLRKIKATSVTHPDNQQKQAALKKLTEPTDTRTFYRRAGRFIDQWLSPNNELNTILAERDEYCFLPDDIQEVEVPAERRKEIITLLKRCSKLTLVLAIFLTTASSLKATDSTSASDAHSAWKQGAYLETIKLYQKQYPDPATTPADVLYNIGNCHHRLEQYGQAALAWRRALAIEPDHYKSRQNLRYLEIEEGSYRVKIASWQNYLTFTTPNVYRLIFYTSIWIFLITLLVLIFLRPKLKVLFIIILFIMPITATLGRLGVYYFPDSDFHTPFHEQAVSLKKVSLYKEAHRFEKNPGRIPVASHLHITAVRGPWTHVETADGQAGWVSSEDIGIVSPKSESSR